MRSMDAESGGWGGGQEMRSPQLRNQWGMSPTETMIFQQLFSGHIIFFA